LTIDYKKLLPASMRTTRWGQFVEALQSVLTELKTDKIEIIENQWNIDEVTATQIKENLRGTLGYEFLSYETGWSSNIEYLKRQILTVVERILHRTTKKAYDYNFYIYNLIGTLYPMYKGLLDETILHPKTSWWTYDETVDDEVNDTLDLGCTLDTDVFPHLDMLSNIDRQTRHLLIPYSFRNVDTQSYFQTEETLSAFYEDILFTKKATEIPYFEPICKVNCSGIPGVVSTSGSHITTKEYYFDYDRTTSGIVKSFYYGSSKVNGLSGVVGVQFGTGAYSSLSGIITHVQTLLSYSGIVSGIIWSADLDIIEQNTTRFNARRNITQKCKFDNYTEVALLDRASGVVAYASFPQITYLIDKKKFYGNPQIDFNLI